MRPSLRMSNRRLRRILLPGMALFLALILTATAGMLGSSAALDDFFGRGQRTVTALEGAAQWDTEYYPQLYANTKESRTAAAALSRRISDEGIVLLKNNGLLPISPTTPVSPMGLRYHFAIYGSTGSGAIDPEKDYVITPSEGLHAAFQTVNPLLEERINLACAPGPDPATNSALTAARPLAGDAPESASILELNAGLYRGAEVSCTGTVGILFLGRQTGEDVDAHSAAYDDGTPHMLALSAAERAALAFAKANCRSVVVVLESAAPMEVAELEDDPGVDAIVWLGGAGCSGYGSLGDILVGAVTPSGRTPDIYPANFTRDPTFANLDDGSDRFVYSNAQTTLVYNTRPTQYSGAPFREYEEGVYLGYKYYETAFDLGYLSDYYDRTRGVLYPFGHGLSYTTFSQEITEFTDYADRLSLAVRITNTGSTHAGKDVVQLYFTPPYAETDQKYGIEKPTVSLIGFEKTELLAPGASQTVTFFFLKEDMASYCDSRQNGDGTTGCYVLTKGDYTLSVRRNSHQVLDSVSSVVPATVWFDNTNPRRSEILAQSELDREGQALCHPAGGFSRGNVYQAATNRFPQLSSYMADPAVGGATILSRRNWALTQPTAPTDADRIASDTVGAWIAAADSISYDYRTDERLGNGPDSLLYVAEHNTPRDSGIVFADLRGRGYHDPLWNIFLDQLTFSDKEELRLALFESAYQTGPLKELGKPKSLERDGPQGLTQADKTGRNWLSGTCAYPSVPTMAATWNQPLMYEVGYMVGQEALLVGINGWYAPALNLHRSPFGGRAAEYFSEDGVLTGLLAARMVSGAGDAGLSCSLKHLVLMETEAHRNPHTAVWLTEQALREVYLKPFELVLKNAKKTVRYLADDAGTAETRVMRAGDFVMTADCAVGATWTSASYELLTNVLRGEWGFQGTVVTDMSLNSNQNRVEMLLRAGCDALMSTPNGAAATASDLESPTAHALLRRAVKNVCYTVVNSNLTQGAAPGSVIRYTTSPWRVWLMTCDSVALLLLSGLGGWLLLRSRDQRRHPERYAD